MRTVEIVQRSALVLIQNVQKLHGGIDDCNGTCVYHIFGFAVTPGNTDGGNAMLCGPQDIKFGVANHDGIIFLDLIQQVLDHFALGIPTGIQSGTANQVEVGR